MFTTVSVCFPRQMPANRFEDSLLIVRMNPGFPFVDVGGDLVGAISQHPLPRVGKVNLMGVEIPVPETVARRFDGGLPATGLPEHRLAFALPMRDFPENGDDLRPPVFQGDLI